MSSKGTVGKKRDYIPAYLPTNVHTILESCLSFVQSDVDTFLVQNRACHWWNKLISAANWLVLAENRES
jgi:hypothetical protein